MRKNPRAKAKEVAQATKVSPASVYQIIHKSKKDQALTMSASPAVLIKYPPNRGRMYSTPKADNVNHPAHYKTGGIETIDFIEAKNLNYHLGNVIKYITRADHKGNRKEDLLKAQWYLNRAISNLEK